MEIQELKNRIKELEKENEELKEQRDNAIKLRNELIEEQKITCISKNKIKAKMEELEERLQFEYVLYEKAEERSDAQYATHRRINMINFVLEILKELLGE